MVFNWLSRGRAMPLLAAAALVMFLAGGLLLLPILGLQYDEVMFVHQFWQPRSAVWRIGAVPLMMMSYLGSVKTWLYAPLLLVAPGNAFVVRIPALLLAVLSLVLTGKLVAQIGGRWAGCVAITLLATDDTVQLTAVFDWGPVVLQNLLLAAGLLAIMEWLRRGDPRVARWAGVLFGLALWNKALFLWNLSGMAVALLVVAWPQVRERWEGRAAKLFAIGVLAGACPLVIYNVGKAGGTLRQNGHFASREVPAKAAYLVRALDGEEAEIALVSLDKQGVDQAGRPLKDMALRWAQEEPVQVSSWRWLSGLVLITAGLLAGTGVERKWICFFLVSGAVGWFESAITQDAGGSIHHTVLFWMHWYAAVALGAACLVKRSPMFAGPAVSACIVILCVLGVRAQAMTYANLLRFPSKVQWRDADRALLAQLQAQHVRRVLTTDWGIANLVSTESRDEIVPKEEAFGLSIGRFEEKDFAGCRMPECVVITHASGHIFFPVSATTLRDGLQRAGMHLVEPVTVYDTHGSATFLLYGIEKATADQR